MSSALFTLYRFVALLMRTILFYSSTVTSFFWQLIAPLLPNKRRLAPHCHYYTSSHIYCFIFGEHGLEILREFRVAGPRVCGFVVDNVTSRSGASADITETKELNHARSRRTFVRWTWFCAGINK